VVILTGKIKQITKPAIKLAFYCLKFNPSKPHANMTKQPKISGILEKSKIAKINAIARIQSNPYQGIKTALN
jgi:hypothetical protein